MLASQTDKPVDMPGGGVAVIRKLTDRQWSQFCRLSRDTYNAKGLEAQEKKGDAADNFILAHGVVSLDGQCDDLAARFDEVTNDGLPFLIRAVLEYTKPEMFAPPEEAAKNGSGPSVGTSTETGPSQTSGGSVGSVKSSASFRRRSKRS